jgi:YD repeat-containing protein
LAAAFIREGGKANEVNAMKRKLIEWTIFGIIAMGLVIFMHWFVPWAVFRIEVATGRRQLSPEARLDPVLRKHLREEETRIARDASAVNDVPSGISPCLVLPVKEGVGETTGEGAPAFKGNGSTQPSNPIRHCLDLVPGGSPVNVAELSLDTATVLFVQTDLYLPGDPPIAFTRVVQRYVDWNSKCQVYLPDEYLTYPTGHRNPYTDMTVWLADKRGVLFNRISKGTGFADAVYKPSRTGSPFDNALVGWIGNEWDCDLADGRTLVFPDSYFAERPQQGSMVGLIEPSGASLTFDRDSQGILHEVRSSDGRWMKLRYQGPILVSIKDSAGDMADYAYDEERRLSRSTNSAGETLSYSYDASGGLKEVESVKTHRRVLSVQYASHGFPTSIQVYGGPVFRVSAGLDFRDDRGNEWFAKCAKFTDSGCQYEVLTR